MRGEAMRRICERLTLEGVDFSKLTGLDFFAREGDWQTVVYACRVGAIEAWEINPEFLPGLKKNLPDATIRIVDSYEYGRSCKERFDFVVLDNPQAAFGENAEYCEHFEALPIALNLLRPNGFLIFNMNRAPFNFDAHPDWKKRRNDFYGVADTSSLSVDEFLLPFYRQLFESHGLDTISCFSEPRNQEYLAYAVFRLKPK